MPVFMYEGMDADGKRVKGQMNAKNETQLRVMLRQQQIRPMKIKKPGFAEIDLAAIFAGGSARIKEKELAGFTRQFSTMINSGVPIIQALDIQITQTKEPGPKRVIQDIRDSVAGGSAFWQALAKHEKSFDNLYVNMVKAGEAGGILDDILARLAKYLEKAVKLKRMVKGAMMYPAIIITVGVVVIGAMLVFVIPKFQAMLSGTGRELPGPTQFVISTSEWLQANIWWALPALIGAVMLLKKWRGTPGGKKICDPLVLKAPVFGDLATKSAVARFCRTLGTLLGAGVSLVDAMTICQAVLENVVFEKAIGFVKKEIQEGKTVSEPLAKTKAFPDLAVQMVTVGESTGELDNMLTKVADYYEDEVEDLVGAMSKMIEPLVLVFLGGAVGGILIAMYLPIFKMAGG